MVGRRPLSCGVHDATAAAADSYASLQLVPYLNSHMPLCCFCLIKISMSFFAACALFKDSYAALQLLPYQNIHVPLLGLCPI